LAAIAQAMTTDPDFASHPLWQDRPAETGALARWQHQPLIAALSRRSAGRMLPRYVARLLELAQLLAGRVGDAAVPTVGALTLPDGGGIGWVVNARGLLVHQARLDGDRVTHYRIVAPTEWNFHPAGALVSALMGSPAHDLTSVKQQAARWVHSLDPCVACRVEIDDA
jgi:coenzyme F420-reducing hydrogenase alpha subunit